MDAGTTNLRRGWTTGACATAAAKAAYTALLTGGFPDPVEITLPRGDVVAFALAESRVGDGAAEAGIVKDAGDDPDVTHGALVSARVTAGVAGGGVVFRAGAGVGIVTRPGLALAVGEPAINPVPRQMIAAAIAQVAALHDGGGDVVVEVAVADGVALAEKTMNGRLGIVGGLSILGTTGIVIPYSCAAWIASIQRGIDVARAAGLEQLAAATGKTSEEAVQRLHGLSDLALIDMGDFVGGTLKYLRAHPVPRLTIAGGIGKMTKLAQGRLDLHSKRGSVDLAGLAGLAGGGGGGDDGGEVAARIVAANTTAEAFGHAAAAGFDLGNAVAQAAWDVAAAAVAPAPVALEILIFDRQGGLVGRTDGFRLPHPVSLNRRG